MMHVPQTITHAQLLEALRALGIDPDITTEIHIVQLSGPRVHGAGIELTVVQFAVDDQGNQYSYGAGGEAAKVATTMVIEE